MSSRSKDSTKLGPSSIIPFGQNVSVCPKIRGPNWNGFEHAHQHKLLRWISKLYEVVLLDTRILQQGHHQVEKMFESEKESLPNGEKK
jgi:hypothetical protein